MKSWRPLIGTICAFRVAHSLTLAAATLGWVNVQGPPVEALGESGCKEDGRPPTFSSKPTPGCVA